MVNINYPHNRLQEMRRKMLNIGLSFTLACIGLVSMNMFFFPYALAFDVTTDQYASGRGSVTNITNPDNILGAPDTLTANDVAQAVAGLSVSYDAITSVSSGSVLSVTFTPRTSGDRITMFMTINGSDCTSTGSRNVSPHGGLTDQSFTFVAADCANITGGWTTHNLKQGNFGARFIRFSSGDSWQIDDVKMTSVYHPNDQSLSTLTILDSGPYTLNQNANFDLEFSGLTNLVKYVWYYDDLGSDTAQAIRQFSTTTATGSIFFSAPLSQLGHVTPTVLLGSSNCANLDRDGTPVTSTGAICTYRSVFLDHQLTVLDVNSPAFEQDAQFQSTFEFSKYNDVIVNVPLTYTYNLSSNFCSNSSISGKRLFNDINLFGSQLRDSGAVLPVGLTGSGSFTFTYTNQPRSDFFYPHIHIYCSNGSFYDVYLGGSVNIRNAKSVSVYESNNIRYWYPSSWFNGGDDLGSCTGSGGNALCTDKKTYATNELVKFNWHFNTTFQPVYFALLSNGTGSTVVISGTGALDLTKNKNHFGQFSYLNEGCYDPVLFLYSNTYNPSDPTTFKYIFAGGQSSALPQNQICVSKQNQIFPTNSGSYVGVANPNGFVSSGGIVNMQGIFGLSVWQQGDLGFGNTGNPYWNFAVSTLMVVVNAFKYVGESIYNLLIQVPPFTEFAEMMGPPPGTVYYTPSKLFGTLNITSYIPVQQFTISYVSETNNGLTSGTVVSTNILTSLGVSTNESTPQNITTIFYAIFAFGLAAYFLEHIL